MLSELKKIIKSTGIYFIGNILSKIITFFMIPYYTKNITASDMGYYDTTMSVSSFFCSVIFMDIGGCILRFVLEKKNIKDKYSTIYSGLLIFGVSLFLYSILSIIIGITFDIKYFTYIAVYGFLYNLSNIYSFISRSLNSNILFALSGVIATFINVICNIVFISFFHWNYKALYLSLIISLVSRILILDSKCRLLTNRHYFTFDMKVIKDMALFSLPLCINYVAFWFLNSANKLIVSVMLDTTQNGYLAIANKFTQVVFIVSSAFQLSWQEAAYSKNNSSIESTGNYYSKAFDLYSRFLLAGLLLLIPFIKILLIIYPSFIDHSYYDSIILIPLALLGSIISIACTFLGSIFGSLKKTNIVLLSTGIGAIINVVVIFTLIKRMGVMAANIAFIAGFTANLLIRLLILKKEIHMKVEYKYFAAFIPLFVISVIVFNHSNLYLNLLCFILISCICLFLFKNEIKTVFLKIKPAKRS